MAKVVNPRVVRRKIRATQNLKKITKAMEMVSGAKLRKSQGRLLAIRPYADTLRELLMDLFAKATDVDVPLLKPRPKVRKVAFVVVSADKGLCGAYNANVMRMAWRAVSAEPRAVLFTVGKKAGDFFRKRGVAPAQHWQGLPADLGLARVREIAGAVIGAYRREEVDEVHLLYTEFVNAVVFRPRLLKFLPFDTAGAGLRAAAKPGEKPDAAAKKDEGGKTAGYIFEPGPSEILSQLIPRYVEVLFYRLLLEALASEHAARMQAMHAATDNASDLIADLTLAYNKARQASITKELLDIVGGAEALAG
jgi:F-type H+-transporting ATPase subunit gamma